MPELSGALDAAVAAHKAGRIDEAEAGYLRVLADRPEFAEAHFLLGLVYLQKDRLPDAERSLRRAIEIDPADARYHNNLGKALLALARQDEALAAFEAALERAPEFDNALAGRGAALMALDRHAEAEQDFRAILAGQPGHADARVNLGVLLITQSRNAEAAELLRAGLEHHPDDPRLLANLANVLEKLNDLDAAEQAAARALQLAPQLTEAQFSLARIDHRRGLLERARERLDALLAKLLRDEERLDALFELGAVLDRLGDPAAAVAAIDRAKQQIRAGPAAHAYPGDQFLARVARCRAWFTRESFGAAAQRAAPDNAGPVFFVGFPRSGTTLMERVLQAHPGVVTTEEDSPLAPVRQHLSLAGTYPEVLARLGPGEIAQAAEMFWANAEQTAGPLDGRLLVDKLPLNIVDLGLANVLFPRARVLVALRDPRDVCLSCYMQYFLLNDAMVNFLDLRQTARTYVAVMDLWLHYRKILTVPCLAYRYEELTDDFDGVVRRVLQFLGVGWHDDVGRYRERPMGQGVVTPSYRNVTDPVYSRSIGRWRAYRRQLAPVLEELRPFATAFGYPED